MTSETKYLTSTELGEHASTVASPEAFAHALIRSALLAAATTIEAGKLKSSSIELQAKLTVDRCGPAPRPTRFGPISGCHRVCCEVLFEDPKTHELRPVPGSRFCYTDCVGLSAF